MNIPNLEAGEVLKPVFCFPHPSAASLVQIIDDLHNGHLDIRPLPRASEVSDHVLCLSPSWLLQCSLSGSPSNSQIPPPLLALSLLVDL